MHSAPKMEAHGGTKWKRIVLPDRQRKIKDIMIMTMITLQKNIDKGKQTWASSRENIETKF